MIERACAREEAGLGRPARQRRRDLPRAGAARRAPDAVTDQTSAHDPLNGYLPKGWTLAQWEERRAARSRRRVEHAAKRSMAEHVRAMLDFQRARRADVRLRQQHPPDGQGEGVADAFDFPGFVPAYIRPLFCRGIGPFRWAALSGDPEDIYRTDAKVKELMPDDAHLHNWLDMAKARIKFQGLPARICWVGLGDRHRLGLAFNEMVATGELKAPIVIGRDHLDSGSVASPNRETEAMRDGSDAVSDWPLLNALLNCASGATWVSLHHGGGVGIGFSQHAGMVIVVRRHARGGATASSACCGTTRRPASCATPTPATRTRSPAQNSTSSSCQVSICDRIPGTECLPTPRSTPAAAAVHIDRIGGHEGASVRAHEQHELADLLGLPEALHRHVVQETLHQFR